VTNVGEYEKVGYRTGLWLGELTHFYDHVVENGFDVTIASPRGGAVPLDPESLSHEVLADLGTGTRYHDRDFMDLLRDTVSVADVTVEDYDAIYFTGGHGVMFDFRGDELGALTARFYESGRIVAAVCHGPVGILNVPLSDGEPMVKGKNVTGFSWPEEEAAQRGDAVPFRLEDELQQLGASYTTAEELFAPYVVVDGNLITGQNPASARPVAEAVVTALRERAS
jgi:putative intracellular protease/amidase